MFSATQDQLISNNFLLSLLASLNALFGFLIQPWTAWRSDRIWTRVGRRSPFILIGLFLTAVFLIAMPLCPARTEPGTITFGLVLFVISVTFYQVAADVWFGCVIPLIGDVVPARLRGRAFALRNIFGMLAVTVMLRYVLEWWVEADRSTHVYPYLVPAAWCVLGMVFCLLVREPKTPSLPPERYNPLKYIRILTSKREYLQCTVLAALVLSIIGVYTLFHSLFATQILGLTVAEFGQVQSVGPLLGFIIAFPIGYAADRVSRKALMLCGLALVCTSCSMAFLHTDWLAPLFGSSIGRTVFYLGLLSAPKLHLLVMCVLFAIGSPLIGITLHPFMFEYIPRNQYGTIMGGIQFTRAASRFLATPIAGAICSLVGTKRASYAVAIFFALCAVVLLTNMAPGTHTESD
jgi:MFS family permease